LLAWAPTEGEEFDAAFENADIGLGVMLF